MMSLANRSCFKLEYQFYCSPNYEVATFWVIEMTGSSYSMHYMYHTINDLFKNIRAQFSNTFPT